MYFNAFEHDNGTPKRVALYIRVSNSDPSSSSIQAQERELRKIIEANKNYFLDEKHIYVDDGISGADESRPSFDEMMTAARNGEIDLILTWKVDRFFRKTVYLLKTIEELAGYGVSVIFTSQGTQTGTGHQAKMVINMYGGFAEMERDLINERMTGGRLWKGDKGFFVGGGSIKYGYRTFETEIDGIKGKMIEVDEEEAEIVRRIFSLFTEEGKSCGEIARLLTSEQIPTKYDKVHAKDIHIINEKKKKPRIYGYWSTDNITKILRSTWYIGEYYYGKTNKKKDPRTKKELVIENENYITLKCPPIIDRYSYDKAQELLELNIHRTNGALNHYFAGLIKCEICGRYFNGYKTYKGTISYRCSGKAKGKVRGEVTCTNYEISEKDLLNITWDRIIKVFTNPEDLLKDYYENARNNDTKIRTLKREYNNLTTNLEKHKRGLLEINKSYYLANIDIQESLLKTKLTFEESVSQFTKRLDEVSKKLDSYYNTEANRKGILELVRNYNKNFNSLTFKQKLDIIKEFIDDIKINGDDIEVSYKFSFIGNEPKKKVAKESELKENEKVEMKA